MSPPAQVPPAPLEISLAQAAANNGAIGQPLLHLSGGATGNNAKNWQGGGTAGVGMKVWQSDNGSHSVGLGGTYSQGGGRYQGHSFTSRPNVGGAVGYVFKF